MALQKGDKVVIVGDKTYDHSFETGQVVEFTGEKYPEHWRGQWLQFKDSEGETQYLLESHYEAYKPVKVVTAVTPAEYPLKVVDKTLPTKASYAVFNASDEIVATTADRDFARELKAALGGKRKGIRIFSYTAQKEIR